MAKFFKTIDDLKLHLDVTKLYTIKSFNTRVQYAIDTYLMEWLGQPQIDALSAAYEAHPTPAMTAAQEALLDKLQRALANFVFYEHIPFAQVTIDDSGISVKENDNYKPAFSGQITMLRRNAIHTAYNALEIMLQFLEDNEADYQLWVASSGYTKNKSLFINKASDFNDQYNIGMSRLIFKKISSNIKDVETFEILPVLGTPFYNELKTLISTKTQPSSDQQIVLDYIKKAVAYLTVSAAVENQWSTFTASGLAAVEHDKDTNQQLETKATIEQASLKIRQTKETGHRYLKKLQSHLKKNIANYPTYQNDTDVNPTTTEESYIDNKQKKHFRV